MFDIEAGKELASHFPTGKAAIHQNHGLFTVGETVDEAAFWFLTMERSCQAQLLAMAAGTPKLIPHEMADVHRASRPASRSPAGSASSRCGRRSAARTPTCSTEHSRGRGPQRAHPAQFVDTASPEALFVIAGISQYTGAVIAVSPVRRVRPATVAWFRVIGAALVLLVVSAGGTSAAGHGAELQRGGPVRHRHRG